MQLVPSGGGVDFARFPPRSSGEEWVGLVLKCRNQRVNNWIGSGRCGVEHSIAYRRAACPLNRVQRWIVMKYSWKRSLNLNPSLQSSNQTFCNLENHFTRVIRAFWPTWIEWMDF